ncbi:DUF3515 domain-containing protein [Streptomyces sp. NPDC058964]|uniref:DUF3515 domain-containing protein n=1 Tax=Streptomyces sp. NPDC058964 TaxID=3346681 RepID=UPI0036901F67
MNIFRHRRRALAGPSLLTLLFTVAGCSSADDGAAVTVPTPDAKTARICRNLHEVLPKKLDGRSRNDPEPRSAYTAGWGSPAIILRCGITRPPKMIDPKVARGDDPDAIGGGVDGVDWLMEKQGDGTLHLTTANREAYVQLVLPGGLTDDSAAVLTGMAAAVKKAVPVGTASMT